MLKRSFDIRFSLPGLALFAPFLSIMSVWVEVSSKGPVFCRGLRVTRHGKPFRVSGYGNQQGMRVAAIWHR